jgi:hypothetical protein
MAVVFQQDDLVPVHQHHEDAQRVMYLVKRPAYELTLVVTGVLQAAQRGDTCCLVRCKPNCEPGTFVLEGKHLDYFYEDLGAMLEYVRHERDKLRAAAGMR